MGGLM